MGAELWNGWTPGHLLILVALLGIGGYCLWDMRRMRREIKKYTGEDS